MDDDDRLYLRGKEALYMCTRSVSDGSNLHNSLI